MYLKKVPGSPVEHDKSSENTLCQCSVVCYVSSVHTYLLIKMVGTYILNRYSDGLNHSYVKMVVNITKNALNNNYLYWIEIRLN